VAATVLRTVDFSTNHKSALCMIFYCVTLESSEEQTGIIVQKNLEQNPSNLARLEACQKREAMVSSRHHF